MSKQGDQSILQAKGYALDEGGEKRCWTNMNTVDLCFKRPGAGKVWGIKKKLELLIFLTKIIHR